VDQDGFSTPPVQLGWGDQCSGGLTVGSIRSFSRPCCSGPCGARDGSHVLRRPGPRQFALQMRPACLDPALAPHNIGKLTLCSQGTLARPQLPDPGGRPNDRGMGITPARLFCGTCSGFAASLCYQVYTKGLQRTPLDAHDGKDIRRLQTSVIHVPGPRPQTWGIPKPVRLHALLQMGSQASPLRFREFSFRP